MSVIADKIRKLIAHEQSARSIGNLAEAEAFAAKVQQLLMEHKLTVSDVEAAADPYGHSRETAAKPARRSQAWAIRLANAVARACFCEAVSMSRTNSMLFFGREADRMIAAEMWRFLATLAVELAAADVPKIAATRRGMSAPKIRDRYLSGFALAIAVRLRIDKERMVTNAGADGLQMMKRESAALEQYKASCGLKFQSRAVAPIRDSLAFRKGFQRGMDAPLRKQHHLEG